MLNQLTTESIHPGSTTIDQCSAEEIVRLIHNDDMKVAEAVSLVTPAIALAVDRIAEALRSGGRLIYLGAGTSGRLGVLDASECPPTFNTDPGQVVGIIAGGPVALTQAVEGAEDHAAAAEIDLTAIRFSQADVLVGIASSGRTPYVIGGLAFARKLGATTIGLVCNSPSEIDAWADILIAPIVGPEIISGSTRMKAGTATKMVLNMLSTGAMIRIGKTYGNLMVDLKATNSKLVVRSRGIVGRLTGLDDEQATELIRHAKGEVKTAIVMHHRKVAADVARQLLAQSGGHLRKVIG
jgi:N-acetylmuramic acid 6-phosphate etherase